ncbi:hypothetical protein [Streptomyces olivaceus]|uniref:hypothetical protein n=1 Tax=Streptomyces olivaceus TaxID=47716 RepID=UPI0036B7764A
MPDTARLYALTSTVTHPFLTGEEGPSLLIHDPGLAMRWYLTHEQEDNYTVTVQASDDAGRTWQALPVHDLLAAAEHALAADSHAGLLRDTLTDMAADWLDGRIRFTPSEDPTLWRPDPPEPDAWRRGGQAWALSMNTLPPDTLLARLTAHYTDPQPEGPGLLRAAAAETLAALALAESPATARPDDLLRALALLERLTYASELTQIRAPAERAQSALVQALTDRVEPVATTVAAHPDPYHPVHETARAYLHQLARTGAHPDSEPAALALARARDALAAAAAAPDPRSTAAATAAQSEPPAPLPGFPLQYTDLHAAAAWRVLSPMARRDAETAMDDLVRAELQVLQAAEAAAVWNDDRRPADPVQAGAPHHPSPLQHQAQAARRAEDHARDNRRFFQDRLTGLDASHALMMHAAVLHDSEQAAATARHRAVVDAAEATLPPASAPRTASDYQAEHDNFMAHVTAAEEGIDHVLAAQRQTTRDALQRLFPRSGHAQGMYTLRTRLIDRSRLGLDDYHRAHQQIGNTWRALQDLEADFTSRHTPFGRPPVTEDDITRARDRHRYAEQYFADLQESRRTTLTALKALDTVTDLAPTPPGSATARAARITQQSRERAQTAQALATPLPNRSGTTSGPAGGNGLSQRQDQSHGHQEAAGRRPR